MGFSAEYVLGYTFLPDLCALTSVDHATAADAMPQMSTRCQIKLKLWVHSCDLYVYNSFHAKNAFAFHFWLKPCRIWFGLDRNTTREAIKKIKHCCLCQGWRLCDCLPIHLSVTINNSKSYEWISIQFSGNDDNGPRNSLLNVQPCRGFGSDFDLWSSIVFF